MSFDAALIVSVVLLMATFVAVISVVRSRFTAARDEEMKQQSSMRGWSYESKQENRFRLRRWKGITDGVEWTAESRQKQGGHGHQSIHQSRWLATAVRGPDKPILCMGVPAGKEAPTVHVATGDSWVAKLAQQAVGFAFDQAVDAYFGDDIGKGVDAKELKPVPGATVPGYTIMAADPDAASHILSQGLTRVLTASPLPDVKYQRNKTTWVLLWKGGIAVGRTEVIVSIDDVERLARLGSAVARLPIA
jgi:hypothetical protein